MLNYDYLENLPFLEDYPSTKNLPLVTQFLNTPLIGEKNNSGRGYRYQSLAKACGYFEVANPNPHGALGDAISTCRVHKAMLAKAVSS